MKRSLATLSGWLFGLACACLMPAAHAENATFPDKPVTMIVPFPAGGSADTVARMLARRMSQRWNQSVIVINRAGAGTIIGLQTIAKATPDGYTIGIDSISHVVQPAVRTNLPYDALKSFTFISKLVDAPFVLTINAKLPIHTLPELVEYLRQNPGKLNYASFGVGSAGHIFFEMLLQSAAVKATHVPYKGTGEATIAQLNGDAPLMFDMIVSSLPHIQNGELRPLLVTTPERSPMLPDTPTGKELGLKNMDMPTWFGLVGPRGLPTDVVKELNAAAAQALQDPAIVKAIEEQGLTPRPTTPEAFQAFAKSSVETLSHATEVAHIPKLDASGD